MLHFGAGCHQTKLGKSSCFRCDRIPFYSKAFDVLLFLVQNPNRLVTKEELLQAVWGDTLVEEGNLTQYVYYLRKALGDNSDDVRLIVTIARKGYQFTGHVEAVDTAINPAVQVSTAERSLAARGLIRPWSLENRIET